jgi:hypothetical protein
VPPSSVNLKHVPVDRWEGSVHRITVISTIADPDQYDLDPLYSASGSGRWTTNRGTVYTAPAAETAWSEVSRNRPKDVQAADPSGGAGLDQAGLSAIQSVPLTHPFPALRLLRLDLALDRLADLTTSEGRLALLRAGMRPSDLTADGYGDCPAIAAIGESLGWQGVRAPSAAWSLGGECIALFEDGRKMVTNTEVMAQGAFPAIYVVAATNFRTGERPKWLPPV